MTSADRTAYPRFPKTARSRELATAYTPSDAELELFNTRFKRSSGHRLVFAMLYKAFQSLGYVPEPREVPGSVVAHLRKCLRLRRDVDPARIDPTTFRRYQRDILAYFSVKRFDGQALHVVRLAMEEAAAVQDHPSDIINAGLGALTQHRFAIPAFSTIDRLARRVRATVNTAIARGIDARLSDAQRERVEHLLELQADGKSLQFRMKRHARKDSASNLRALLDHLEFLGGLVELDGVLDGVPELKRRHLAAEAQALDAGELRDYQPLKRRALLVCQLDQARATTRDALCDMFIRRMAKIHRAAKDALDADRLALRDGADRVVATMGDVMRLLAQHADDAAAGREIRHLVEDRGGMAALLQTCEALTQHTDEHYLRYILKPLESFRALFMRFLRALDFISTTEDTSLIDAIALILAHRRGEYVSGEAPLAFAPHAWRALIIERASDGTTRHRFDYLQACVFTCLARELRSGDVAVLGALSYADFRATLPSWEECEPLAAAHCAQLGIPADPVELVAELRERLSLQAEATDAAYVDNAALTIDDDGAPHLTRHRARPIPPGAEELARAVAERMPVRGIIDILWDVHCWTDMTRHFGPVSGSEPKLDDPASRYLVVLFAQGCNLGPAQAARHMRGAVSAHQISYVSRRHFDAAKLEAASRDVINAYANLQLPRYWGDGKGAAADGTQQELWDDNLMAAHHVRYGGTGAIAYHHISNTYVALYTQFIPPGVWEGHYLFDGLLQNTSELQPDRIHTDTQGQSLPGFGLAYLLGVQLMPRIRNWHDYTFYRPAPGTRYTHINALFDDVVDWSIIERHWKDLMQVVVSIRTGRLPSATLLRKLGNKSPRNRLYQAFRALGSAVRTLYLLRYINDEQLRVAVTAATNQCESYNAFADHLAFGGDVIAKNDPIEQEKAVKYQHVVANAIILWNAVHQTRILRQLQRSGWKITAAQVACLSPYTIAHINRFGDYWLKFDELPDPIDGAFESDG